MLTKKSYFYMYKISKEMKCFNWIFDYTYLTNSDHFSPSTNTELNYKHLLYCHPYSSSSSTRFHTIPHQSLTIQVPHAKRNVLDSVQIDLSHNNKFIFKNPNAYYTSNCTLYFRPDAASFY